MAPPENTELKVQEDERHQRAAHQLGGQHALRVRLVEKVVDGFKPDPSRIWPEWKPQRIYTHENARFLPNPVR
jgi:hypothetical protein